ncbi:DUF6703 family protein [Janibacter sp. GXQ6167]|uniref:DUF6703 family protein n=1 Tax=Janibacter sp. GXQ6167 TaxID=3240791 RepID=UPI0035260C0B
MAPTNPQHDSARDPDGLNALQRASVPLIRAINSVPSFVPILVIFALIVGGGLIPGWGWILMTVAVLFLTWMLAVSWPRLTTAERLMRIAVLVFVAAITVTRAIGR